ncbi:hypothetical protein BBK36DRAFT_1142443 [Trichoderma citrinoviride]|uniref:Uncharacterized protein n=1 Tax=Trichoderma citrinoviride TaxID=58853 RepID=A0A2T4B807_9HYPO|nr:hypothetical protein BBK36DRAFT_1142443 [Trichoderma citrinoviride]PTB65463.1 hypothetical protein BBK36DRAFT_1142443 [Trichoderma citrinoviride]
MALPMFLCDRASSYGRFRGKDITMSVLQPSQAQRISYELHQGSKFRCSMILAFSPPLLSDCTWLDGHCEGISCHEDGAAELRGHWYILQLQISPDSYLYANGLRWLSPVRPIQVQGDPELACKYLRLASSGEFGGLLGVEDTWMWCGSG